MSSGLDMSLDDLIKQSKYRPKPSSASSSGPTRRPSSTRAAPYPPAAASKAAASPYGVYSEHVAAMAAGATPPPTATALETGTKLYISNLDAGVTTDDVQELFSEVGEIKRYSVNYDRDGRSKGTAEVVYARKADALAAIKRYHGVLLDGKAMKIELIGSNAGAPTMAPLSYNHAFGNYNSIANSAPQTSGPRGFFQGSRGGRGSSSQGSGDRVQGRARVHDRNRDQKSVADLDAELDQYHAEAMKQK